MNKEQQNKLDNTKIKDIILKDMKNKLSDAIEEEDYERAEKIQTIINNIENKINYLK